MTEQIELTIDQVDQTAHALLGTCRNVHSVLEELEIEIELCTAEDQIADLAELCTVCGWWYEPCELVAVDDDAAESGICDDCRKG